MDTITIFDKKINNCSYYKNSIKFYPHLTNNIQATLKSGYGNLLLNYLPCSATYNFQELMFCFNI